MRQPSDKYIDRFANLFQHWTSLEVSSICYLGKFTIMYFQYAFTPNETRRTDGTMSVLSSLPPPSQEDEEEEEEEEEGEDYDVDRGL